MEDDLVERAVSKIRQTPQTSRQFSQLLESDVETTTTHRKRRKVKRKKRHDEIPLEGFDIPGVVTIAISLTLQNNLECVVGEDVTAENAWKYVSKEVFVDDLELNAENSDCVSIQKEILNYPDEEFLLGYIPDESRDYDEFYICLTVAAQKTVTEVIERNRIKQEERLNNSILKQVQPWKSLGSDIEVDRLLLKNNRPLVEVEVESGYPIMNTKCRFRLRFAEDARDGYMELLAGRTTYTNVLRKRIDTATQVTPLVTSNAAQTLYTYPTNAWTQYEYEYKVIENLSKEFKESIRAFVQTEMDEICDNIYVNSNLNLYTNDYQDLIRNEKYTHIPSLGVFKRYTMMSEETLCLGKEISGICWHPMWTGTVAVSYTTEGGPGSYRTHKPNQDEVYDAMYNVPPVLIWSFKDHLYPRLILETPREVNVVSFCPHNENILVGGCLNGQVLIWDIKNKIQCVEQEELLTSEQLRYRALILSLMKWMKNTKDLKFVRYTAVSEITYSHRSCITDIRWISPFREINPSGMITEIGDEEKRTSLQFMTSSRDGTILTWDLHAKPLKNVGAYKSPKSSTSRLKKRPAALNVDHSPFKLLNRVFIPMFKINVFSPNTSRNLPLTSFTIRTQIPEYKERYPDPKRKFQITKRILYDFVYCRPTNPLMTKLLVGTGEGDFLLASWEGFEFNAGEIVNKENAKTLSTAKYHDGPIMCLARSDLFPDLCLTVGGTVFALWMDDLKGKPVMWRRCKHRYTHGAWNSYRPEIFRLSRSDGYIEVWHLKLRSDKCHDIFHISTGGLMGTFTHPRRMLQNVIAVGDRGGLLKLYYISHTLSRALEEDKCYTYNLLKQEVTRKNKFIKWQTEWLEKNEEYVKSKREKELAVLQIFEEQIKTEKKKLQEETEKIQKNEDDNSKYEPGNYAEMAQREWRRKEKERMNKVLLSKKFLSIDILEKQQLPLKKAIQEENQKKRSQEYRLERANKVFEDTVAMLFPEAVEEKPQPPPDPYAGGDPLEVKQGHFEDYVKIEKQSQEYVDKHEHLYNFNWIQVVKAGRERRRVLDGYYSRSNHKNRIAGEREEKRKALWASQHELTIPQQETTESDKISETSFDLASAPDGGK